MKLLIKYLLVAWLCLVATFATQAQGIRLWEKKINARPRSGELLDATESQSKKFWVAVTKYDKQKRPNSTQYNNSASVLAFRADTGDTLWYKKLGEQYYNTSTSFSDGWGVVPAPNKHFWAMIQFDWTAANQGAIALFKLDSMGNVVLHKEFMRDCRDFTGNGMFAMPDGGFIICGSMYRPTNCSGRDVFAMRIDGEGNEVWTQVYNTSVGEAIATTSLYPGNKFCIGYYDGNNYDYMRFIDAATGVMLYERNILLGDNLGRKYAFPMRDGTFIVSRSKYIDNKEIGYLARTDAYFNVIWDKLDTSASFYNEYGTTLMKETHDNAVIITGGDKVNPSFCLFKMDLTTGAEIWRKNLKDTVLNRNYVLNGLSINAQNDLYVLGNINLPPPTPISQQSPFYYARYQGIAQFVQPSDYCSDSLRAKITGSWQLDTLRLRSESNAGVAFQDTLEYQWFINGTTVSMDSAFQQNISAAAYPNGLLVKLLITNFWGCKDSVEVTVTPDGINGTDIQNRILVRLGNAYPNPSTQHVSISYTLPTKTENGILRVYEMSTGRTVAERNLSALDGEVKFHVGNWATGVYAYQLFINGVPVAVKQMVVTR